MDNQLFDPEPTRQRFIEPLQKKTAAEQARDREQLKTMARSQDPITSFQAAAKTNVGKGKLKVLECLQAHPDGLNDYEISVLTGMEKSSAAKRRKDLGDLVEYAGFTRPTNTGSQGKVWKLRSAS